MIFFILMKKAEDSLREHGSKATPGRIAILSVLQKNRKPMSVADIISSLPQKLNQTTVYRALETLTQNGAIQRVDLGHTHAHYEITEGTSHHHHITCLKCNKIKDLAVCAYKTFAEKALREASEFAEIKNHSFEIFGICKNCVKK